MQKVYIVMSCNTAPQGWDLSIFGTFESKETAMGAMHQLMETYFHEEWDCIESYIADPSSYIFKGWTIDHASTEDHFSFSASNDYELWWRVMESEVIPW